MGSRFFMLCMTMIAVPLFSISLLFVLTCAPRGLIRLATIDGEATILYEKNYGVPYINATSKPAAFYALGFAHAADRLYDLQFRRAYAYGQLAEVNPLLINP